MFTRQKTAKTALLKTVAPSHVLPILKADHLLSSFKYQGALRELQTMLQLSPADYDRFYGATVNRFAEFVQVMPVSANGVLSGLLNEGLSRAIIAAKTCISQQVALDPLITYAVFTAALCRDLARVVTQYRVVMVTEEGSFIEDWQFFEGSLVTLGVDAQKAKCYRLYPIAPVYQRIETSLTQLLAQYLLPREAFLWIVSDLRVYADWLDALGGVSGQGGIVAHILTLLPPDEIQNLLNVLAQVGAEVSLQEAQATEYGDLFYEWLVAGIESGEILVNTADAAVHIVADGVFLETQKIFHHFAESVKLPVAMNVVFTQFGNLFGIAEKGGMDFVYKQQFGNNRLAFSSALSTWKNVSRDGMFIADAALFFKKSIPVTDPTSNPSHGVINPTHQLPVTKNNLTPRNTL